MLHKNKLFTSFEKYNLTERDVTFIKELIAGGVLEATTCTSEVWFRILCEKGGVGGGRVNVKIGFPSEKCIQSFTSHTGTKNNFSSFSLCWMQIQQSRGAWLHPQACVLFGRIEWTSKKIQRVVRSAGSKRFLFDLDQFQL